MSYTYEDFFRHKINEKFRRRKYRFETHSLYFLVLIGLQNFPLNFHWRTFQGNRRSTGGTILKILLDENCGSTKNTRDFEDCYIIFSFLDLIFFILSWKVLLLPSSCKRKGEECKHIDKKENCKYLKIFLIFSIFQIQLNLTLGLSTIVNK